MELNTLNLYEREKENKMFFSIINTRIIIPYLPKYKRIVTNKLSVKLKSI